MTNNEVIKYLKQLYPNGGHCWLDEQRIEAIGMAVKALQEEPVSIWHDANIELPRKDKEVLALVIRPNLRAYVAFPSGHGTLYSLFGIIDINDVSKWCYIDDILNLSNIERTTKNWKEPVSEDFDALDQLLAKYAIDFSYKGKTLKECSGRYKAEIIATANHLEPVSDELEKVSKEWLIPQLDKSYANYGEAKMMELTHFDGYAMLDAIEFGAQWQKEQIDEILLSEVLPCFMYGGEADEVVAKLDEVLNQKK